MEEDQNICEHIRDLLTRGKRLNEYCEYFSDSDEILEHWRDCEHCQIALPDAIAQIEYLRNFWVAQIREDIEKLYREHEAEKQDLIRQRSIRQEAERKAFKEAHPDEPFTHFYIGPREPTDTQRLDKEFMELLGRKGDAIREQLQIINDNWGLDYFRLARAEGGEGEYSSRVCGPLIGSLSNETRTFAFQAVLAADLLKVVDNEFSPTSACAIHQMVDRAAAEYLRVFIDKEGILTSEQSAPSKSIEALHSELRDGLDSIKAGQMEMFRRLDRQTYQPHEIEEDLRTLLGKELFGLLTNETRRKLFKAEVHFRGAARLDDFDTPISHFHRAFECEFRYRISGPLAKVLVANGHSYYDSTERNVKPFVVAKEFNGKITLGHQLWYLRRDKQVRDVLSGFGFKVDEIVNTAVVLNAMRNKATHEDEGSHEQASRVRDMLLGSRSILKALFPRQNV